MRIITTVVGITHRGTGCECGMYVRLMIFDLRIGTKIFRSGGGRIESEVRGEVYYHCY